MPKMSNNKFLSYDWPFIYKRESQMKKPYFWNQPNILTIFIQSIQKGEVVLADCDTVMGLFAAVSQEGVQALDTIKTRRDKPYLIIIGTKTDWMQYVDPQWIKQGKDEDRVAMLKVMDAAWPGPITFIVPMRPDLPAYMGSTERTVALRMPDHAMLCAIARACGGLFSTSANKAGKPIPITVNQVHPDIIQAVTCIVLDEIPKQQMIPSTILDCTTDHIKVIRQGVYPVKELEKIYGKPFIW